MFKSSLLSVIFFLIFSHSNLAFSGGPLVLAGPNGNTPVRYAEPTITLHTESGGLGIRSNAEVSTILQAAFGMWNNVTTATISLNIDRTSLNYEVDETNIAELIANYQDGLNPVIYDYEGVYIDQYFGPGSSDLILGFSGASAIFVSSATYVEGYMLINGKETYTDAELLFLLAHESGHFFGIDHSQLNIDNQESYFETPGLCTTTSRENYPLMYPYNCRNTSSPHADDISAASALYPTANINGNFGTLQGRFLDDVGNAILGANIWVINTTTGESYSVVSDYLMQNTGFYKLFLPAGNYTLHANSINSEFSKGSGVGPYATSITDLSFLAPHPITPVTYQSDAGGDAVITIAVNQTVNIDFNSNGAIVVPPNSADKGDSFSDLFGATSPFMLILFLLPLTMGRTFSRTMNRGISNKLKRHDHNN